ncbi:hypothetical protein Tco_1523174 [Tanacetum coccineum]
MNGPYVRRMIPEPGDADREVPVPETFHEQTDDELTVAEIKQMEADDQAIQTILLGLPEDIYAAVDNCSTGYDMGQDMTDADGVGAHGGNQLDSMLANVGKLLIRIQMGRKCSSSIQAEDQGRRDGCLTPDSVVDCSKGRKQEIPLQAEDLLDCMSAQT